MSRDEWWQDLDGLYLELSHAKIFLREAEGEARLEQAERARQQISALTNAISEQRARPFSI